MTTREEQNRNAQERLEALLLEGLDSPSAPMTAQDWQDIRQTVKERADARNGSR